MNKITTTSNFDFIQESFIKAKIALNKELRTGIENPNRLKGVGLEGASRTGKSWDISVFICHYVSTYQGKQINVCRDHLTTLKKTFYQTLKKVWVNYFKYPGHHFNKTSSEIHFNNNIIRFVGVNDDIMISHGLESDLLIINEAMGVDQESINQLEQRCNEFYIYDYNPSEIESFLYDKENEPSYRLHKTIIFDNPYAPLNAKAKILSYAHPDVDDYSVIRDRKCFPDYTKEEWEEFKIKNLNRKTAHKYNWEVYGLGKRAVGEDIIFPDWEEYTEEPDDSTIEWEHVGGDFGFKADPTTAVKVKKQGNNLYLRELFHVPAVNPQWAKDKIERENIKDERVIQLLTQPTGIVNNEISVLMKYFKEDRNRSIWDKAEEKSVIELRNLGLDAWFSDKGAGSVAFGIQKMHQFNIFIHKNSLHLKRSFSNYRWKKDRNGNYIKNSSGKRVPLKKDDHTIDASRYPLLYYYWIAGEENHESDI